MKEEPWKGCALTFHEQSLNAEIYKVPNFYLKNKKAWNDRNNKDGRPNPSKGSSNTDTMRNDM